MNEQLFQEKERVDMDYASHNDNTYDYLDRSGREEVKIVRDKLNEWFNNYPKGDRHELKCRFKSSFSSAFYELFLYELFLKQGFEIAIHPAVPNSNKRPDFLLKKGETEFYLEAKEAKDMSSDQEAYEKRINQVYDSLNELNTPNFFLRIEDLILKSKKQPSIKKLEKVIENKIEVYDPDLILELIKKYGWEGSPKIEVENDDIFLSMTLIPKDTAYRNLKGRAIGAYHFDAFIGGAEDSIKSSFQKKAKRYGKLDKPYLICINIKSPRFSGAFDVNNAIWGSLTFSWSDNPSDRDERLVRMPNGLFLNEKGPSANKVSGILITDVMEFSVPVSNYWFAQNPFARYKIDFDIFDMSYQFVRDKKVSIQKGKTVGEILNIDENWIKI